MGNGICWKVYINVGEQSCMHYSVFHECFHYVSFFITGNKTVFYPNLPLALFREVFVLSFWSSVIKKVIPRQMTCMLGYLVTLQRKKIHVYFTKVLFYELHVWTASLFHREKTVFHTVMDSNNSNPFAHSCWCMTHGNGFFSFKAALWVFTVKTVLNASKT